MNKSYLTAKLIFLIWYGQSRDALKWDGLVCEAKLGPIARTLKTTNYRLKDHFARLEQIGCIKDLSAKHGSVSFTACIPAPIINAFNKEVRGE